MVLKISKKTKKNAFLGYDRQAQTPLDSFDKFHKQKSCPLAVLPVCMQEFLILILQLAFSNFGGFMCHCTALSLNNLSHAFIFCTKQTVPAKERKVGALVWYSFKTKAKCTK